MSDSYVISPDKLSATMKDLLDAYNGYIVEDMKAAAEKAGKAANTEIKAHTTFRKRSGKYVRAFKVSLIKEGNSYIQYAWHVKAPHYRLTHLLENGHKTRSKGNGKRRTNSFPHIKYGERIARMVYEQELTEAVKRHG